MSVVDTVVNLPRSRTASKLPAHVVMLTNFIPPYRLPVYSELAKRVEKLTILLNTPMEPNRSWRAQWGSLDVRLQRTFTVRRQWRHAAGFSDTLHVHVPIDTWGQLKRLRPDLILTAELGFRSLFSGVHSLWHNVPLALWLTLSDHTEQGRGRLRHALRRWLLSRADAVVVNGASGARYVERFGFDRTRIFQVPYTALPGVFDEIPARRPAESAHRLLYVGQLIERKGLLPFVQALASWALTHRDRSVQFDLAGGGPVRDELAALRLPPNLTLTFLGERDYASLAEAYTSAGIFAFPTLADEWGLVVNEALSAGLPVLGSRYSQAVEELCRDGENGWTFRPGSQAETVQAIDRALTTPPEELDRMRLIARGSTEHLTPRFAVDALLPALEAALARSRSGRRPGQSLSDAPVLPSGASPGQMLPRGKGGRRRRVGQATRVPPKPVDDLASREWPKKLDLFGVGISPTNYDEAVELIVAAGQARQSAVVACQAVHAVVTATGDLLLRERVNSFDLVTPDGQPVRWALNWLHGAGLNERVYGPELMLRLCREAAGRGVGIYLYGGTPPVLECLAERLTEGYPGLRIAGYEAPPFRPLSEEEDEQVVARINDSGAGIVFIGLGCPKQDHFAYEHRQRIRAVQICVGAAFDFHAGIKPMAPVWMQRRGLEWLFRLACEPRRLARRYLVTNSVFMWKLTMAMARRRKTVDGRR